MHCSWMGSTCTNLPRSIKRLLQKSTVSQSCSQDCLDFAERMKRKALRGRSEGSIPPYVTKAESRKQHSDSPLCNSLIMCRETLKGSTSSNTTSLGHSFLLPSFSLLLTFLRLAPLPVRTTSHSMAKAVSLPST